MSILFGPNRQSIRLPEYDYASQGIYYITMCMQDRLMLLGNIKDKEMQLSPAGEMIQIAWRGIVIYNPRISLDEFIVMPNHFHGIIIIGRNRHCGQGQCPAPTISLFAIVRRFKSWTTNQYQKAVNDKRLAPLCKRLWQRNYYEHIVRNDDDLNRIREYIRNNPANWEIDPENKKSL
jgi:REP element-mobilizing transposase RayT